jgi:hypothetical protein
LRAELGYLKSEAGELAERAGGAASRMGGALKEAGGAGRAAVRDFLADETGSLDLGGNAAPTARGYVSNFREILARARAAKAGDVGAMGEIEAAKVLRSEGTNVHFQKPVGPRGPNTADFLVGGEKGTGAGGIATDVLTPRTAKPENVLLSIADKNDQAQHIIVNLRHTSAPITGAQLGDIQKGLNELGATNIKSVKVIE